MCIESEAELLGLCRAGKVVAIALSEMRGQLRPGVTTAALDAVAAQVLERYRARSAPRLFYGFPGTACISINDEAVHGVPGSRQVAAGDLVTLDVTVELDGYVADAAITVPVSPASDEQVRLCRCASSALDAALRAAQAGHSTRTIGRAVETEVRRHGFAVLRELAGHGVGRAIHEEPQVPNYDDAEADTVLTEGLVIAVEPIISAGGSSVRTADDDWTIATADGSLSAHFEHTIVVTQDRPLIVTAA